MKTINHRIVKRSIHTFSVKNLLPECREQFSEDAIRLERPRIIGSSKAPHQQTHPMTASSRVTRGLVTENSERAQLHKPGPRPAPVLLHRPCIPLSPPQRHRTPSSGRGRTISQTPVRPELAHNQRGVVFCRCRGNGPSPQVGRMSRRCPPGVL